MKHKTKQKLTMGYVTESYGGRLRIKKDNTLLMCLSLNIENLRTTVHFLLDVINMKGIDLNYTLKFHLL